MLLKNILSCECLLAHITNSSIVFCMGPLVNFQAINLGVGFVALEANKELLPCVCLFVIKDQDQGLRK